MSEQPDIMVWRKKSRLMMSSLERIISENSLNQEKVDKAQEYLEEIRSYRGVIPDSAKVVNQATFLDVIKKSGFTKLENVGYIQVATAKKLHKHEYRVYMTPLTEFL
ncbi:hypothetical protein IKF34_00920 [Candidatus Saccharibacteria bacterium]|nr:hypothetical protein [Candidatus Saccharibacteria bacterium]